MRRCEHGLLEVSLTSEASPVLFHEVWDWTEGCAKKTVCQVSSVGIKCPLASASGSQLGPQTSGSVLVPQGGLWNKGGSVPQSLVSQETKEKLGNS